METLRHLAHQRDEAKARGEVRLLERDLWVGLGLGERFAPKLLGASFTCHRAVIHLTCADVA